MEIRKNILFNVGDVDIINGKFTIPAGITGIGYMAFANCFNLEELDANNIEKIDYGAFRDCKNLKKVNMPHLKDIWNSAFCTCVSLPCPNDKVRKEIYDKTLEYLNKNKDYGLCEYIDWAITDAIIKYKQAICRQICFPLFTYQNAKEKFGATGREYSFWWPRDNREIRKEFLKWCYEDDISIMTRIKQLFRRLGYGRK